MKKLILISVLLTFTATCFSQNGKWKKTQKINTIESYQEFIDKYPQSEYSDAAELKLIELEFYKAEEISTVQSYNYFLIKYKYNSFTEKAKNNLIYLEYQNAKMANSISAYEKFLQNYPQSTFSNYIYEKIEPLLWKEAEKTNTIESYNSFLSKYPNSQYKNFISWRTALLKLNPLINYAEQGKIELIKSQIEEMDKNQKSESFMMAVYGALHTYIKPVFINGQMEISMKRTSTKNREYYIILIQILLAEGANPALYDYKNYNSVATAQHKQISKKTTNKSGGTLVETWVEFGDNSETSLVLGGTGESAEWVARIEGAEDILSHINNTKK